MVRQLRPEASELVSQFLVLRTLTLSGIRNDNMYKLLATSLSKTDNINSHEK
jgi:hypothetical protein